MAEGGFQPRRYNRVCRYFLHGVCNRGDACLYLHVTPRQEEAQPVTQNSSHGGCTCGHGCRSCQVRESLPTNNQPSLSTTTFITQNQQTVYNITSLNSNLTVINVKLMPEQRTSPQNVIWPTLNTEMPVYEPEIEQFHRDLCPLNSFGTCPAKERCLNLHGDICDVCKMPRLHPTNRKQRVRHRRECLAVHQRQSQDKECGICLENVIEIEGLVRLWRFGILENCNHTFCINCKEQWRYTLDEETLARRRTCPMCRSHSELMMPCENWIECPDEKRQRMIDYREEQPQPNIVFNLERRIGNLLQTLGL